LSAHDPLASRIALRLMQAYVASGDRAAALRHARVHAALLEQALGVAPDPAVVEFADELRTAGAAGPGATAAAPPRPETAAGETTPTSTSAAPMPAVSDERPAVAAGRSTRPPHHEPPRRRPAAALRRSRRAAAAAVVLVGIAVVATQWTPGPRYGAAATANPTIAVLPFADLSPGRDGEYFSDGITEELINTLARLGDVQVASRTSAYAYKDQRLDVRDIARQLGVATVLEGSVRRHADSLRIAVQLVDAVNGYPLWGKTYDRRLLDVLATQNEIADSIVGSLREHFGVIGEAAPVMALDVEPAAYNEYLAGRFFWHRRTEPSLRRAVASFERAVELAPDFAAAYAGLADAYAVLGFYDYLPPSDAFPRARATAERALELDPSLAAAHATLGYVALYYDWDLARSENAFRRSIELDPGYSTAQQWLANLLTAAGRFAEAEAAMRTAQRLDPLSVIANAALGWSFYFAGANERALEQLRNTLAIDPSFELAHLWMSMTFERMGQLDSALHYAERAVQLSGGSAISEAAKAQVLARRGDVEQAQTLLATMRARSFPAAPPYEIARLLLALGDTAAALDALDAAIEGRSHSVVFMRVDPNFSGLNEVPRFREQLRRAGLER
jgi:TolB-like protein/Tfp pilus assembly protein PilF